jgi:MurNAc alpha-1-phosphate uridylyltransferase
MTRCAMILAAGRGERMRPLSQATPKPLLEAGGKPLIVWQIEALARAGYTDLVIMRLISPQAHGKIGDGARSASAFAGRSRPSRSRRAAASQPRCRCCRGDRC